MNTKTTKTSDLLERLNTLDNQINGARSDKKADVLEEMKYKKAFWDVVRGFVPKNALSEKLDGSGGFLVPDDFDNKLVEQLEEVNTLRRLGRCIKSGHERKIPVVSAHGTASWVDEMGGIVESDEIFGNITLAAYKLGTQIRISDELLEDCGLDLECYISEEFVKRIGKTEEEAFVSGDGNHKPRGILLNALQGAITTDAGVISMDDMIDLYYSIGQRYRGKAVWVMNDQTFATLYKLKESHGKNIWKSSVVDGEPFQLLGCNVEICESMPAPIAGNKPVLFGDFSQYLIADRNNRSLKRLNELYAASGQVGFLMTQRVDAKLLIPQAIKYLQIKE